MRALPVLYFGMLQHIDPADRIWLGEQIELCLYGSLEDQALDALADTNSCLYDRADNFRLADESEPNQVAEFECIREIGCCGRAHFRLGPSPSGRFYLYGFNYGH